MKILRSAQLLSLARKDFALYASAVYPKFEMPRHVERLIQVLEQVERGEIKRAMISMPPRHGKTLTTSTLFPAWYLGRDPRRSVAIATYGETLAQDLGRKVQGTLTDRIHGRIFPEAKLAGDVGSSERLEFQAGGSFFAVSRSGALTGRGCDLAVCDDLLKDENEARSPAVRRSIVDFYTRVLVTRLVPDGAIVLVGTRWGKGDLFDYLLDERGEEQWTVLNFPAIAEADDELNRPEGAALWPEKYSVRHLQHKQYEMGTSAFTCLYQGRPAEASGIIFRREWWRSYTQLPELKRTVISLDSAFKTGLQNDYSALQVWGEAQTGFYLLANWKQRVQFPDLKRALVSFAEQWKPNEILIEDAASGISLVQELKSSTSLPIKAIQVDRDKVSRAQACSGMVEAGRVYLPAEAPWLADFLDEVSGFPQMPHDDQTDAATMALNYLRGEHTVLGVLELMVSRAWDGFTSTFKSPKPAPRPNLGKAATLEFEKKLRGLTSTQPDGGAWKPKAEPCRNCKSSSTVRLGAMTHCNACGADQDPDGEVTLNPDGPCCAHPLLVSISGMIRCQQCGHQSWPTGRPQGNGPSRTDYLAGRIRAREFKYPGRLS